MLQLRSLITALALAAALSPVAHAAYSDKTFTLTNTGDGPLTITTSAQPISGNTAEYALTGNTCISVAPGASCSMTVRFTPTGSGTRTPASLNFTSNGTNGSSHSIALTGSGGASCTAGKQVFSYTGANRNIVVPAGCTTATVKAWGAGGKAGYRVGGGGGFARRALAGLVPGTPLVVVVGQGAVSISATYGFGGSGDDADYGAAGGGLSGVFTGSVAQTNALIIAGGGGGGSLGSGGAGGGLVGGEGQSGDGAGAGGTQSAGGRGSYSGAALYGGNSHTNEGQPCSGGGGGYFGGGAAVGLGAGGGSGYAPGGTLIAGSGCTVANTGDSDYVAGIGNGGCSSDAVGQNGRVVIIWQ